MSTSFDPSSESWQPTAPSLSSLPLGGLDQAAGLRNRQVHLPSSQTPKSEQRPRVILVHESPITDVGLRWTYLLAKHLSAPATPSWVIDLAPCASRLRSVLSDDLVKHHFLWSELGASHGNRTSSSDLDRPVHAAGAKSLPTPVEQLPRLYEQLMRHVRKIDPLPEWVLFFASESRLPMDRACWQAAEEIVLISRNTPLNRSLSSESSQLRLVEFDPRQRHWRFEKQHRQSRIGKWLNPWHRRSSGSSCQAMCWPEDPLEWTKQRSSAVDAQLSDHALRFAKQLVQSSQNEQAGRSVVESQKNSAPGKNIQLPTSLAPMKGLSDKFRA